MVIIVIFPFKVFSRIQLLPQESMSYAGTRAQPETGESWECSEKSTGSKKIVQLFLQVRKKVKLLHIELHGIVNHWAIP